ILVYRGSMLPVADGADGRTSIKARLAMQHCSRALNISSICAS
ncbi:jg126, partial [Pararge aegeria aegeria]